jgi:dihydrodipicolinate synthase/N-acetylneuraminate lyase
MITNDTANAGPPQARLTQPTPTPDPKGRPAVYPPLTGVLPVLQTPFTTSGAVDHAVLRTEAQWCLDQGVSGLVVGMVSEVVRLGDDERVAVTRTLASVAGPAGRAMVASVGSESTHTACARARAAADAGATALMATPPVVMETDEDGLYGYYAALAAATDLPLVVQDASGYVGRPMSIGFQVRLMSELGDRVWFKPEAHPIGQRVSDLRDGTHGQARILEGTGGIALVDTHRRGVVGTMPAADICWAVVALWNALEAGDVVAADRIHGPLSAMISMQSSLDAFIAIEKHLLVRQGVLVRADMREPVGYRLDAETAAESERLADLLAIVVTDLGAPQPLLAAGIAPAQGV